MRDKTDALETLVSNLHVLALAHPALEWKKKKKPSVRDGYATS